MQGHLGRKSAGDGEEKESKWGGWHPYQKS